MFRCTLTELNCFIGDFMVLFKRCCSVAAMLVARVLIQRRRVVCRFTMWSRGGIASPGMREIAETGAGAIFLDEVEACGDACGPSGTIPCSPMAGVCSGSEEFLVSGDHAYLSTAAMLAPSPDWCATATSSSWASHLMRSAC